MCTNNINFPTGARNLETALLSYGVKHGHDKCKINYRESTQNMCEIEEEFERRIGRFKVTIDGNLNISLKISLSYPV